MVAATATFYKKRLASQAGKPVFYIIPLSFFLFRCRRNGVPGRNYTPSGSCRRQLPKGAPILSVRFAGSPSGRLFLYAAALPAGEEEVTEAFDYWQDVGLFI